MTTIRDQRLAASLLEALPALDAAELQYSNLGQQAQLYLIPTSAGVSGAVTLEQMRWLYENSFVGNPVGRRFYDIIKVTPSGGICPLCKQRVVGTVDHYLPQSNHALLTVTPLNLIPACEKCNYLKRADSARTAEEQTLHPYFDALPPGAWLHAELEETSPPTIRFRAEAPIDWPDVTKRRIERHFAVFGLAELYGSQAAVELVNIAYGLARIYRASGPEGIRIHLEQELESREYPDPSSWQSAFYRALACSEWFHSVGHFRILEALPLPV
ncbi:MAG: HNH endonuclease signature motif containing protein [Aquabacterium sp.]